tara:strand:+ start:3683 stop:5920 length:2238 start_codon:yes stop_codon:yes gene_type:complete
MKVSKDINKYCMSSSKKVFHALESLSKNTVNTIFIKSENKLVGCITDGDVRRFIIENGEKALNKDITEAMNTDVKWLPLGTKPTKDDFTNGIKVIPICDDKGFIEIFYTNESPGISIGERVIGEGYKPFIIAEIGINHQGSLELAKTLIDIAKESGADCAKFQMRDMSNLYNKSGSDDPSGDLGTQYTLNILEKSSLTDDEMFEAFDYCNEVDILPMCTPWDESSLKKLEAWGMQAYKVASADFTNIPLLEKLSETNKPLFLSTGMCSQQEIAKTIEFLESNVDNFCLLHCNSTYPAPYKDVNLSYIKSLKTMIGETGIVGYSGHERGWFIPCVALSLGACVIEKHITVDKSLEGNDHKVSLLPHELNQMVQALHDTHTSMGSGEARKLSQGEMINRQTLSKSVVASRHLNENEIINKNDLDVMSPGNGLQPNRLNELVGLRTCREIKKGQPFFESDIEGRYVKAKKYNFKRPFGIPVRFHDYSQLREFANLDFVEFHMSSNDLKINPSDFLNTEDIDFAVHAPDLFENDHIIDIGSSNDIHRKQSIINLQEVINVTRNLKDFFPKTKDPVIVLNVGGWSKNKFMSSSERDNCVKLISNGLNQLESEGVTLTIQTMPPFPWHFGGQGYCNFFTHPDSIVEFCDNNNVRVCLDISHCLMSSNYFKFDFFECISKIGKYVSHIHISDADGVDGEGVVFGEGDLDLKKTLESLNNHCPKIQFLPEIWQGHNNSGMGFWDALKKLDGLF